MQLFVVLFDISCFSFSIAPVTILIDMLMRCYLSLAYDFLCTSVTRVHAMGYWEVGDM